MHSLCIQLIQWKMKKCQKPPIYQYFLVCDLLRECSSLTAEQLEKYSSLYQEPEVFLRHHGEILSYPAPDSTISMREIKDMGYFQGWGFPLREQRANQLFDQGVTIYMLDICSPASRIPVLTQENLADHAENGGIFAVAVHDWVRIVDNELHGKESLRDKLKEKEKEKREDVKAVPAKVKGMERE